MNDYDCIIEALYCEQIEAVAELKRKLRDVRWTLRRRRETKDHAYPGAVAIQFDRLLRSGFR